MKCCVDGDGRKGNSDRSHEKQGGESEERVCVKALIYLSSLCKKYSLFQEWANHTPVISAIESALVVIAALSKSLISAARCGDTNTRLSSLFFLSSSSFSTKIHKD